MKKIYLLLAFLFFSSLFTLVQAQTIHYIKENGAGTKDGTSWANASDDIQEMINVAAANDQVWVAGGTYNPNRNADNIFTINSNSKKNSFLLKKDVKLYGGFAGTETTVAQRSLTLSANKTILSGELSGSRFFYNVLISSGDVGTARIDGFIIFSGNIGHPYVIQEVNGNMINSLNGSGMHNYSSSPTIANCIFNGSDAQFGGGMYNYNSSPTIINCTFYGNTSYNGGGDEIYNESSSSPKIYNSIVWGAILNNSSTPEIKNSIIKGSSNTTDGNIDASTLTDVTLFKDPVNGDYSLKAGGTAVNAGSNTLYTNAGGNLTTGVDAIGNIRVFQNTIDIGAYESQIPILTPNANNILYVNKAATGEGSGNSWENAIPELADALVWANNNKADFTETPLQIWVAGGTYKPMYSPEDGANFGTDQNRDNAFLLVNNVEVYGGFAGTEATVAGRNLNLVANTTTLSGDFGTTDVVTGSGSTLSITENGTNAYHVIISIGDIGNARLDGFTISGGNADGTTTLTVNNINLYKNIGGGIFNHNTAPLLTNLVISGNYANGGGGIYNDNSNSVLSKVSFSKNTANFGGGMYNEKSNSILTNVIFNGNRAKDGTIPVIKCADYTEASSCAANNNCIWWGICIDAGNAAPEGTTVASGFGGGLYNNGSSPIVTNVTFSKNKADADGGGMYNKESFPNIYNNLIIGNIANTSSPGIYNENSTPVIKYSLIQGLTDTTNGNIDATGLSDKSIFNNPANDDYSLNGFGPALNAGDNSLYTGTVATDKDLAGSARLFVGIPDPDVIDLGAYEYQAEPLRITATNGVLYVNKMATGNNTGNSWANAVPELADALVWANRNKADFTETPLQIWVAGGTYKPMYSPEDGANFGTDQDKKNVFLLVNNVQLYGGFAGTETTLAGRDLSITVNKTTLSGDVNDDDVITGYGNSTLSITNNTENTYRVVISAGDVGTARLDGFTITGGNYFDFQIFNYNYNINGQNINSSYGGGGMLNQKSSPTIATCSFIGNVAQYSVITDNGFGGGGMFNVQAAPIIINCLFTQNKYIPYSSGDGGGGGMSNYNASPIIVNSTFFGNSINGQMLNGTEFYGAGGSLKIYNSIVWGYADSFSGFNYRDFDTVDIQNNLIHIFNTVNGNINATGLTDTNIFNDPTNGNFTLKTGSVAINAGKTTLYTNAGGTLTTDKDLAGNRRKINSIDIGSYESQVAVPTPDAKNILYVNKAATGEGTGDSWTNAIPQLADALVWAQNNKASFTTTPLQIWVAGGTYKPLYSPEDGVNFTTNQNRDNTFLMVKNVQVYGSFEGTETALVERNLSLTANATTLSGDIGIIDDNTDNTYHVVVSAGDVGTARLDGFTISGGYANSTDTYKVNTKDAYSCSGAGIYNSESNPKYINLTIKENSCTESGGGMFSYKSTPNLQNISIENNQAKDGGGMANQYNSYATLLNVAIKNNNASLYGSGLYNVDLSNATLINTSIVGNKATINSETVEVSAGCASQNSSVTLKNSIVWDEITGDFMAQYSLIKNKSNTDDGNIDATGLTDTAVFSDPTNGDYTLKSTSPAVNTGNNSLYTGTIATDKDLSGNARLYDGSPSTDVIDMGAYELQKIPFKPAIALSASSIDENVAAGTEVGMLSSTDVGSNVFTYALVSGTSDTDNSAFTIIGKSLKINASPDFETKSSYTVRIVTSDGISTFEKDFTITINDLCEIDNTVTQSLDILTATTTGASYQWHDCSDNSVVGTNSNTFTPIKDGEYKVVITVGSCAVTSACIVVAKLGTTQFDSNSKLLIYPNPASNVINIQSDVTGNFIIINQLGQTMKTIQVDSDSLQKIDVSFLADGIYFIKENNNTQSKAKKIILKK